MQITYPDATYSEGTPWETVVSIAIMLREHIDSGKWNLGDLALAACDAAPGRPKAGQAERTISALADAIGEERSVISALRNNSLFYDSETRSQIPVTISWRIASECRQKSGWTTNVPIEPWHRANALNLINDREARMDAPPAVTSMADRAGQLANRLEGLKFENDTAAALLRDAIATARLATCLEDGESGTPEGEVVMDVIPQDAVLPVWSLESNSSAWAWLAALSDEQRGRARIIILDGPAWEGTQTVRVRVIGQ